MNNIFYTQFYPHYTLIQQSKSAQISKGSVDVYQYLGSKNFPKENFIIVHEKAKIRQTGKHGDYSYQLDMLILSPLKGFLEIEVKAGKLLYDEGKWNLNGIDDPNYHDPYPQTKNHRLAFKKYFKDNNNLDINLSSCVCFPNVENEDDIDYNKNDKNKDNFTIYKNDLPNIWEIINEKWVGSPVNMNTIKTVWDELVGTKFPNISVNQEDEVDKKLKQQIQNTQDKNEDFLSKINNIDNEKGDTEEKIENNIIIDKKNMTTDGNLKENISIPIENPEALVSNNLYKQSPLRVFLDKLLSDYFEVNQLRIKLYSIFVSPSNLSDPSFLLGALLVASSEDWSIITQSKNNLGGFQIYIETDDSTVLGYKVINLKTSNLFLFSLAIINRLNKMTREDNILNFSEIINQYKYWNQSRELDTLKIDGLNNEEALKEITDNK